MCTAISLLTVAGSPVFGRNLDFGFPCDPHLIAVPAHASWHNIATNSHETDELAFAGLGQLGTGYPVFLDGVNECGLAGATLFFPGFAHYDDETTPATKPRYDALDLLRFMLGHAHTAADVRSLINTISIVSIPNTVTHQQTPLHWIFVDKSNACIVVEIDAEGTHVYDNPAYVLTNSPTLPWHLLNLHNYSQLTAHQPAGAKLSDELVLAPFGQGAGSSSLPGGYTPAERFVRAAFMRSCVSAPADPSAAAVALFHALEPEAVPLGSAQDAHGQDFTQYSCAIDVASKTYFWRTYHNPQLFSASWDEIFERARVLSEPGAAHPKAADLGTILQEMHLLSFFA